MGHWLTLPGTHPSGCWDISLPRSSHLGRFLSPTSPVWSGPGLGPLLVLSTVPQDFCRSQGFGRSLCAVSSRMPSPPAPPSSGSCLDFLPERQVDTPPCEVSLSSWVSVTFSDLRGPALTYPLPGTQRRPQLTEDNFILPIARDESLGVTLSSSFSHTLLPTSRKYCMLFLQNNVHSPTTRTHLHCSPYRVLRAAVTSHLDYGHGLLPGLLASVLVPCPKPSMFSQAARAILLNYQPII